MSWLPAGSSPIGGRRSTCGLAVQMDQVVQVGQTAGELPRRRIEVQTVTFGGQIFADRVPIQRNAVSGGPQAGFDWHASSCRRYQRTGLNTAGSESRNQPKGSRPRSWLRRNSRDLPLLHHLPDRARYRGQRQPSAGAERRNTVFIASSTTSTWPRVTAAPGGPTTWVTWPGNGATAAAGVLRSSAERHRIGQGKRQVAPLSRTDNVSPSCVTRTCGNRPPRPQRHRAAVRPSSCSDAAA